MIKNRDYQFWHRVFYSFGILLIVSIWITIYTENFLFLIIPAAILFTYLSVNDFRFIYFLLICCLPLSIEHQFQSGFSTDIPSEPLMVCLMFLFFAYVLTKADQLPKDFFSYYYYIDHYPFNMGLPRNNLFSEQLHFNQILSSQNVVHYHFRLCNRHTDKK